VAFAVPDEVDWREVEYLKGMCLVSLFEKNKEIFRAVVLCAFRDFLDDPAFQVPNSFYIFCVGLSVEMREAYSSRAKRPGDLPKALTRAIWSHLALRGKVKGSPQEAFEKAKDICDPFCRFIAVQALAGRLPIPQNELDKARATRDGVERGTVVLGEVSTIKNLLKPGSSDC